MKYLQFIRLLISSFALGSCLVLSAQIQIGNDIDGAYALDRAGTAISMPDASIIAIGEPYFGGSDAGRVRIFEWTGTAWAQKGNSIYGEAADDRSGTAVSMPNANTIAIGAYLNDGIYGVYDSYIGHVRVYEYIGSSWVQKGADIDGEAANDYSGISVSMPDSNTVAIGARSNDSGATDAGHVRIYTWNGSAWTQYGNDINGESAYDYSGSAVSMPDISTVAIGAPYNDEVANMAGHVRVFTLCTNTTYTDTITACDSYTWIDGNTYTTSNNIATWTLANAAGCDSIVTLDLTINAISDITTSINGITITASNINATYQWLDCDNNFAILAGETNQTFTPSWNGNYAVELTENGCVDTTACVAITTVGVFENLFDGQITVYPNPTNDRLSIIFNQELFNGHMTVMNSIGQVVYYKDFSSVSNIEWSLDEPAGIYILRIVDGDKRALFKVIKE